MLKCKKIKSNKGCNYYHQKGHSQASQLCTFTRAMSTHGDEFSLEFLLNPQTLPILFYFCYLKLSSSLEIETLFA